MPADDFDALAARADFCRLLAACFYQPGPELAEEKVFDAMLAAAAVIEPRLAAAVHRLGAAFTGDDPESLLVDYTRLFIGPVGTLAQPYGAVWLERRPGLMQDSTQAVTALYEQGGFEIAEDFRDLPDHVAAELEFLYLLLFRRAEALRNDDSDAGGRCVDLQRRLLDEHLGRWVPPFAAAMGSGAETAFYRELAGLTDAFVRSELAAAGSGGGVVH
jgi:TorA maturation chaperone TorD